MPGQGQIRSATEQVACMTAINYYFSLLLSKALVNIANQNLTNAGKAI